LRSRLAEALIVYREIAHWPNMRSAPTLPNQKTASLGRSAPHKAPPDARGAGGPVTAGDPAGAVDIDAVLGCAYSALNR
jgi:hypothetical protein